MAKMARYCKAYPLERFRQFPGWKEDLKGETSGDQNYLFIQEDYSVTKGIFLEEGIVFNDITAEWVDFCANTLNFQIPPAYKAET